MTSTRISTTARITASMVYPSVDSIAPRPAPRAVLPLVWRRVQPVIVTPGAARFNFKLRHHWRVESLDASLVTLYVCCSVHRRGGVAQVAEQGSHKPRVGGSSPPAATMFHDLPKRHRLTGRRPFGNRTLCHARACHAHRSIRPCSATSVTTGHRVVRVGVMLLPGFHWCMSSYAWGDPSQLAMSPSAMVWRRVMSI